MSRRGLGRGLDALLPSRGLEERGALKHAPVEAISVNPRQPRREFHDEHLRTLAASVGRLGILQPLLVREVSAGVYELIAGERRLRAARLAGIAEVPVIVIETDEQGSLERALVENIHRQDLNPLEEAAAYRELLDETGVTQEELGERLGRGRATIANSLRLLDLPDEVKGLMVAGRLTGRHGKALLALQSNPFQVRLAQRAAHEGLTVRQTEELIERYRAMTGDGPPSRRAKAGRPAIASDIERRLGDRLQSRVRVDAGARKGRIVIEYVSADDLERLASLLLDHAGAAGDQVSLE